MASLSIRSSLLFLALFIQNSTLIAGIDDISQISLSNQYSISTVHNNRCLDVEGFSLADSTPVQIWDCHASGNQKVRFIPTAVSDVFEIQFVHSGKCLDVANRGESNGTPLQQSDCHHGVNQQFKFIPDGYFFRVQNFNGKFLDLNGSAAENADKVVHNDASNHDSQKFLISYVNSDTPPQKLVRIKICQALNMLKSSDQLLKTMQAKMQSLDLLRTEWCNTLLPSDRKLQSIRKEVEKLKNQLGNQRASQNVDKINALIRQHNQLHNEITPKIESWQSETKASRTLFDLAKNPFQEGMSTLEKELHRYWEETVIGVLSDSSDHVAGFMNRNIEMSDEGKMEDCISIRIQSLKYTFSSVIADNLNAWEQCKLSNINYLALNAFFNLFSPVANLAYEGCEQSLSMRMLMHALLVDGCFEANLKKREL